MSRFMQEMLTPGVLEAQRENYGRDLFPPEGAPPDELGADERAFIAQRDSFYMATVSESGWPYIQHRGGPPGFVRIAEGNRLVFGDLAGNRQMLSVGNLGQEGRVALFFMDYAGRRRLKVIGEARISPADELTVKRIWGDEAPPARLERVFEIEVLGLAWNCPQHITPRFTEEEVLDITAAYRERIAELEARLEADPDA